MLYSMINKKFSTLSIADPEILYDVCKAVIKYKF